MKYVTSVITLNRVLLVTWRYVTNPHILARTLLLEQHLLLELEEQGLARLRILLRFLVELNLFLFDPACQVPDHLLLVVPLLVLRHGSLRLAAHGTQSLTHVLSGEVLLGRGRA